MIAQENRLKITALAVSLLWHLVLLFLFTGGLRKIELVPQVESDKSSDKERRIVFELIETPENIPEQQPDMPSDLVSDRSTAASDQELTERSEDLLPASTGELEIREYPEETVVEKESAQESRKIADQITQDLLAAGLLEEPRKQTIDEEFVKEKSNPGSSYQNLSSSVKDFGALSFNTYEWEFAPYMLAMKRKIEGKIKPPPAFYHMGIISGENQIRFIVNQDGTLRELQIVKTEGHESLTQTSKSAIEWAAPFLPLPDDFPEEYLEVTARFSYRIRK